MSVNVPGTLNTQTVACGDSEAERFVYDGALHPLRERSTGLVLPELSTYAVRRLIEIMGVHSILPEFEEAIRVHHVYCRVSQFGLVLA